MEQPEVEFPPDVKVGPGFDDALRQMVDRPFLASQKWQEQQWRANREGVHPWLIDFEKVFVRRMSKLGVPVFCQEAVRTDEQQAKEIAEGDSKVRLSPHQRGCAVHLIHSTKGWNLTKKQWALFGHVGKEIASARGLDLEWGGDWKSFYDPAHWQVKQWRMVAAGYPFPRFGG